jgi:dimethylhistidine N-methyltransferase
MDMQTARQVTPQLIDYFPPRTEMRSDVLKGLSLTQKAISPKYFYDARGSHLFEDITQLPEYYLTRTERGIMEASIGDMAEKIGPGAAVIEFGSGAGNKIRLLLNHLQNPVASVAVEISRDHLLDSSEVLANEYPQLQTIAVCADFTQPFELPPIPGARRNLVFFPGSTIGNFPPDQAIELLKVMNQTAGERGALLIGADLVKDACVLEAAYNDCAGVTAEFNLNLLAHINRELRADFDLHAFRHRALYNKDAQRIEMYLVSQCKQVVHINDQQIRFQRGERILTEYAYKYELDGFAEMASRAGFSVEQVWTDPQQNFSVQYLVSERPVAVVQGQRLTV